MLSTSVDGKFVFSDIDTEEVLSSIPKVASGAVLALEFNPVFTSIAAAGCMNGDVLVFDWEKLFLSGLGEENQNYLIDTFKDHGVKHVLSVKWSDDGVFLATASNDHSLQVYRFAYFPSVA